MTNYEKIKAMSVEEMADAFYNIISCEDCPFINQCVKKYSCYCSGGKKCREMIIECLESEVEENMLPEICSCGYRFENDETICPNCGKKVEEDG